MMRTTFRLIGATLMALGLMSLGAMNADAGFLGQTIHGDYLFPDGVTVFQDVGNQVVSPTATFNFAAPGVNGVVVSDTQIFIPFGGTPFTAAFNGPRFTEVGVGPTIIGVTIDPATNVPGFDLSRVVFTSNSVAANIQSLQFPANGNVTLDVVFQQGPSAPEPSSIVITGTGLLIGMGCLVRRRRRLSAA